MIDPSPMEQSAMTACLQPLGEYVASINMTRPLADYSKNEILTLIEVVVTAYTASMADQHAAEADKTDAYFAMVREQQRKQAAKAGGRHA
ncbi:DUF6511 domain-containing protein [Chitinibacter sp. GC72]|uniref:DUF6511 domain-containing protein n=1 Tax=Chitinibacter sp. GC72 TaxID=1526917 RepID=UPI0012F9A681|nr:DUF6511 domain-containing protein [Chitinibacter sp. GC72]